MLPQVPRVQSIWHDEIVSASKNPEMIEEEQFRLNLTALRKQRGLSQGKLAELMVAAGWDDFYQATISRIEKGTRPVRLGEARTLAKLLGADVASMLSTNALQQAERQSRILLDQFTATYKTAVEAISDLEEQREPLDEQVQVLTALIDQETEASESVGRSRAVAWMASNALSRTAEDVAIHGVHRAHGQETDAEVHAPTVDKDYVAQEATYGYQDDGYGDD